MSSGAPSSTIALATGSKIAPALAHPMCYLRCVAGCLRLGQSGTPPGPAGFLGVALLLAEGCGQSVVDRYDFAAAGAPLVAVGQDAADLALVALEPDAGLLAVLDPAGRVPPAGGAQATPQNRAADPAVVPLHHSARPRRPPQ